MKKTSFGMVGGGLGSFIGDVHRHGAMIDDLAALRAGCFSRSREKSLETARAWDIPEDRVYGTFQEMADRESARDDGIDFVTVATPNSSHYEIAKYFLEKNIHVMCDKPVTMTVEQAEDLKRIAEERKLLFAVSYAYTGYPVIRQARRMIEAGTPFSGHQYQQGRLTHFQTSVSVRPIFCSWKTGSIPFAFWSS